jgi:hypothetical protein
MNNENETKDVLFDDKSNYILDEKSNDLLFDEKSNDILEDKSNNISHDKSGEESTVILEDKSTDILEEESTVILEDKSTDILEEKSTVILEDKSTDILEEKSTVISEEKSKKNIQCSMCKEYGHNKRNKKCPSKINNANMSVDIIDDNLLFEQIRNTAEVELNNIMERWCYNYENNYNGGRMRGDRGADLENYIISVVSNISKMYNNNIKAIKGSEKKEKLQITIDDDIYVKEHQVDVHIYLNNTLISVIESKAYLDSCYYERACNDFNLFKKYGYRIKNYVFTLENSINDITKKIIDFENSKICDNIFYMLDGKRSSSKPIYNKDYKKKINLDNLSNFIKEIINLTNI